ncbi:MAG: hypothetical protein NTZ27_01055 [Ignavibacteriales bacterium]|nr:hypothetical protein [Ignavibacteriales bacterium]
MLLKYKRKKRRNKKRINYIFILIWFTVSTMSAQTVSIIVSEIKTDKAFVYSLQGEKTFLIDSIQASARSPNNWRMPASVVLHVAAS